MACTFLGQRGKKEAKAMKVKEAMHKGAIWVPPTTPLTELAKLMRDEDIGAIPIGENDKLIGMVTDRDIAIRGLADGKDPKKLTARDVMTKAIHFCRTEQNVEDAAKSMRSNKVRRLPVINDRKRLVGMLALGDISAIAGRDVSGELLNGVSAHH
jgi:CBS domain-containing protein